jgi:hypothetical protein
LAQARDEDEREGPDEHQNHNGRGTDAAKNKP